MRGRGGGGALPPVSGTFLPARRPGMPKRACAGQMSAVSTALRMAMMATSQQVDVDNVAPDAPRVSAALEDVRRQYTTHRLTSAAMDPSFAQAVVKQSSQGSASRNSAPGGGGA